MTDFSYLDGGHEDDWIDITVLSRRRPRAKKVHKCNRCPVLINPGEQYIREFVLLGTDGVEIKRHQWCPQQERVDG